jgi:hypothetical protein
MLAKLLLAIACTLLMVNADASRILRFLEKTLKPKTLQGKTSGVWSPHARTLIEDAWATCVDALPYQANADALNCTIYAMPNFADYEPAPPGVNATVSQDFAYSEQATKMYCTYYPDYMVALGKCTPDSCKPALVTECIAGRFDQSLVDFDCDKQYSCTNMVYDHLDQFTPPHSDLTVCSAAHPFTFDMISKVALSRCGINATAAYYEKTIDELPLISSNQTAAFDYVCNTVVPYLRTEFHCMSSTCQQMAFNQCSTNSTSEFQMFITEISAYCGGAAASKCNAMLDTTLQVSSSGAMHVASLLSATALSAAVLAATAAW